MKRAICFAVLLSCFGFADPYCIVYPEVYPHHVNLRTDQGNGGIGFNKGYSSVDLFLSRYEDCITSFLDVRGHAFNDGKVALNGGIGVRGLFFSNWALGSNLFYDGRKGHHHFYNQASLGIEVLRPDWGLYFNGYVPIAPTSHKGNEKIEFAMRGVDAAVGGEYLYNDFTFSALVGPYYFYHHSLSNHAVGGKGKVTAKWSEYLSLGVTISYDNEFKTRALAEFAITFPFGCTSEVACCNPGFLDQKQVSAVQRNEIIVLNHKSR